MEQKFQPESVHVFSRLGLIGFNAGDENWVSVDIYVIFLGRQIVPNCTKSPFPGFPVFPRILFFGISTQVLL